MADDLSSKLNGILSDPAAMQQIMSMASGLMGSKSPENSPPPDIPSGKSEMPAFAMPAIPSPKPQKDDRCELLTALKPFLRESRADRVDMMIRVLQITKLVKRR